MKNLITKTNNIFNNLFKSFLKINITSIFFLLAILVFLTQFYSINQEVIDWDETDFILMGNSFYKGNLPYLELWDLKPPIHFILIGLVFKIFGPSLLVARLLGDFLIFLSAVLIFFLSRNILNKFESLLSSIVYIFLVSFNFSQPTMTEYTSTFFILLSIYFLYKKNEKGSLYAGIFISLSILTRTNVAFVLMFLTFYFYKKKDLKKNIKQFILGSSLPLIFLILLYGFNSSLKVFFYSVFLIPLGNTIIREDFLNFLNESFQGIFFDSLFSIQLWFLIFLLFVVLILFKKRSSLNKTFTEINSYQLEILLVVFVSLILSILVGGRFFYHYLIQLFPFLSIFILFFIKHFIKYNSITYMGLLGILIFNLLPIGVNSINNIFNYKEISNNYKIESFVNYIEPEKELLALDNHLIYFYLDTNPLTPIVHPNTIAKKDEFKILLNDLVELGYIVENQFQQILKNNPDYIFCEFECDKYLPKNYLDDYLIIKNIEDLRLYRYKN